MSPFEYLMSLPLRERVYLVLCGIAGALICWMALGFGYAMGAPK